MTRRIIYYAEMNTWVTGRINVTSWRARGFQCVRWAHANRVRGYMGLVNCNNIAQWAYRHAAISFTRLSEGWTL
jgi:hypothetical protein